MVSAAEDSRLNVLQVEAITTGNLGRVAVFASFPRAPHYALAEALWRHLGAGGIGACRAMRGVLLHQSPGVGERE